MMVLCMLHALWADNINGLLVGTYISSLENFVARGGCHFDIEQLGSVESLQCQARMGKVTTVGLSSGSRLTR
jgi:hypothetical protein